MFLLGRGVLGGQDLVINLLLHHLIKEALSATGLLDIPNFHFNGKKYKLCLCTSRMANFPLKGVQLMELGGNREVTKTLLGFIMSYILFIKCRGKWNIRADLY